MSYFRFFRSFKRRWVTHNWFQLFSKKIWKNLPAKLKAPLVAFKSYFVVISLKHFVFLISSGFDVNLSFYRIKKMRLGQKWILKKNFEVLMAVTVHKLSDMVLFLPTRFSCQPLRVGATKLYSNYITWPGLFDYF